MNFLKAGTAMTLMTALGSAALLAAEDPLMKQAQGTVQADPRKPLRP